MQSPLCEKNERESTIMRELKLDEIHNKTLELMDHVHEICEQNGIDYYLHYGTLIGAVRHHGFIPWDDDFDIAMKRKDFDRFCHIIQNENHPFYKLCNRANTSNYYYGIPRYVDTRFQYVSEIEKIKEAEQGIFIDIYPLDNFGNSPDEAAEIKRKCTKLNFQYIIYTNWKSTRSFINSLIRLPLHIFYRIRFGKGFHNRVDEIMFKRIKKYTHDSDSQIGLICWDTTVWPMRKEWFTGKILVDYENRKYWIPKGYHEILTMIYKNYMELPPEKDRAPHHNYRIIEP